METATKKSFNVSALRAQFPALHQEVYGKPLVYFDNGATSQKPQCVIDAIEQYYAKENANIHRGVHYLSQQATEAYEQARRTIQSYIGAADSKEIIFTKGTTDAVNLVAFSVGETLQPGDEIVITAMEHHSNIVPWQMVCERKQCILRVAPINKQGEVIMEEYHALLSDKTKLVAFSHISNALGTINPIEEMMEAARKVGALTFIDGAQSIQHTAINVQQLNCDFYAFSGHKVFAPTGIGVLYGKADVLNKLPPYQGGGDMIAKVTFERTTYNELPFKFEAGTPNIAGAIGLGKAIEFLSEMDLAAMEQYEKELAHYATQAIESIAGCRIIGTAENKTSVVSFVVDGLHPFDVGTLLDKQGIAVRTGHHCAQPIMDFFEIPGTIRASFAFYNTKEEIDLFIHALNRSINLLK